MKTSLLIIAFVALNYAFSQGTLTDDNSVLLEYDFAQEQGHTSIVLTGENYELSKEDLKKVDKILSECISNNKSGQNNDFGRIGDKAYYYQLLATKDTNGDVFVFINALNRASIDSWNSKVSWREELKEVYDGGNSFWRVNIDLTNNSWSDLYVNGI
ncbi:MAG: hypothetical protein ACI857_002284 [Arenicella sp.]|jgi:hypothetical protein